MSATCTREEMRELDRRAMEEYGIPGVVLMENAGAGAARIAIDMLADPFGMDILIFCGKGNNGGDGFVVARHLHNAGARVHIVLACPSDRISAHSEAGINLAIAQAMGLPMLAANNESGLCGAGGLSKKAELIIDALLGTGLGGDVREPCHSLIHLINAADKPVLSIDIPSGLDANLGKVLRTAVRADRTATFVLPKRGFRMQDGPTHVGKVDIIDIGMPKELIEELTSQPPDDIISGLAD
jgi:hydroxyethylthiazole kinase-like uncharacterized protein yjeF